MKPKKPDIYDKLIIAIIVVVFITSVYGAINLIFAAEHPMPLDWYMAEYHRLLYSQFNLQFYMLTNLIQQAETLTVTTQTAAEILRITNIWQIAITSFQAGFLLILIFAIVWSKTT